VVTARGLDLTGHLRLPANDFIMMVVQVDAAKIPKTRCTLTGCAQPEQQQLGDSSC
jgi:hypothetical protein